MQKILRFTGKTAQVLITVLLAVWLICNLYLIMMERIMGVQHPDIFGCSAAVVASGSMEPALSVDDLIFNHEQECYGEGDIITFQNGDSLTTHRIIEVTEKGYVTQGDANNTADLDEVPAQMVIGKVVCAIPYVGNVLALLKTPSGMALLIFTGLCMMEFPFFLQGRRDQTDGEER